MRELSPEESELIARTRSFVEKENKISIGDTKEKHDADYSERPWYKRFYGWSIVTGVIGLIALFVFMGLMKALEYTYTSDAIKQLNNSDYSLYISPTDKFFFNAFENQSIFVLSIIAFFVAIIVILMMGEIYMRGKEEKSYRDQD